jgi:hypothetical protein
MWAAEYTVPGQDGAEMAKISVMSAGGTLDANIQRWKGQFHDAAGGTVEPKIQKMDVDTMPVTIVEFAGDYAPGMGLPTAHDQEFLTAVIERPANSTFIKFVGPRATVEANRAAFMTMVKGLRRTEAQK